MFQKLLGFLIITLFSLSCQAERKEVEQSLLTGAAQTELYLPLLKSKSVALVVNQTATIDQTHLLDTLLASQIKVVKVFAPEHGFRGDGDAGELLASTVDKKSGVAIQSLYGSKKKPSAQDLSGVDVVVFDIQDVGVRFYTYISTLKYVMEACAENNKELIVLDRPNPNGNYIDGPVLQKTFTSFVGVVPIPLVYGLTIGELALMMNGEKWLMNGTVCKLKVVEMANYNRNLIYDLPIKPSPNLPNTRSIRLYPSLCFFEATDVSVGRGTNYPFQVIGYPDMRFGDFTFTPKSINGAAKKPLQENRLCYGVDLRDAPLESQFTLSYLIDSYSKFTNKSLFFTNERFFNLLAGNDVLIKQIKEGMNEDAIRMSWKSDIENYKKLRSNYLLYP